MKHGLGLSLFSLAIVVLITNCGNFPVGMGFNFPSSGSAGGSPVNGVPATTNSTPVGNAGPDQNVVTGSVVVLDGSGSSDANGDTLMYSWSFTSKPDGSAAALSDSSAVKPTFTADQNGSYVLSLIVNDGQASSAADTVMITATAAHAPIANAGPDQNVVTGSLVVLNGGGSSSASSVTQTYSWSFTSKPAGSTAALSSSSAVNPTFTADKNGPFVLSLIVSSGRAVSEADTVVITAAPVNMAPVADAGPELNVAMGSVVALNGSGSSDANGDTLTYTWSFTSKPAGSAAALSDSTAVNPTFTADVEGTYVLSLFVSDGIVIGNGDLVIITAIPASLVIDQQQPVIVTGAGGVGIGGASQEKLAQVVTAGMSGILAEVWSPISCASGDLIVEIQDVAGGVPNGMVLASKTIPGTSLPSFSATRGVESFRILALTTPVPISAGSQFAIVLSSTGQCGVFQGPIGDSYSGGNAFFETGGAGVWTCICDFQGARFDLPFRTLVEPAN